MSYYSSSRRGGDDEAVDDFDEFDPTPYGGGYDIVLTFGPPIAPCEETCYPSSSSIDYDRPQYSSYSQTSSAYGDDYSHEDRYGAGHGFSQPTKPSEPAYGYPPPQHCDDLGAEESYGRPKPGYGFQPGMMNRPGSEEDSGFGYGGRPKRDDDRPSYGGFGMDSDRPGRYGNDPPPPRRQEEDQGYGFDSDRPSQYKGEDYPPPRRPEEEEQGYGYQGSQEYGGYGGRRNERPDYERPSFEEPPRRPAYERRPDEEDEPRRPAYGRSNYGRKEEDEDEPPRRYQESSYSNPDQEEGFGSRPKYGDDSDDEEKKRRHHKHHHHHKYADDDE